MSWTFNDIKYGWKIAAGITLAGTTIFVVDNQRQRINQADVIEIVLGTYERCLATQYQTNPIAYHVAPPEFVRNWQDTNGVVVVTNTIGWRIDRDIDRDMLVDLDDTIKALVPYYIDTNTVYVGSSNIIMLTVTGLWAELSIGNGTNQFTSYGYRITTNAFVERYKVLNALKITKQDVPEFVPVYSWEKEAWYADSYLELYNKTVAAKPRLYGHVGYYPRVKLSFMAWGGGEDWGQGYIYNYSFKNINIFFSTQLQATVYAGFTPVAPGAEYCEARFDDNGFGLTEGVYNLIEAAAYSDTNSYFLFDLENTDPVSGSSPTNNTSTGFEAYGFDVYADWQFRYATTKFW